MLPAALKWGGSEAVANRPVAMAGKTTVSIRAHRLLCRRWSRTLGASEDRCFVGAHKWATRCLRHRARPCSRSQSPSGCRRNSTRLRCSSRPSQSSRVIPACSACATRRTSSHQRSLHALTCSWPRVSCSCACSHSIYACISPGNGGPYHRSTTPEPSPPALVTPAPFLLLVLLESLCQLHTLDVQCQVPLAETHKSGL